MSDHAAPEFDQDEIDTLPGTRRGPRVLLAEDDIPLRELLTSILDLEGHDVTAVPSADEMRRELAVLDPQEHCRFDAIVTDVRMPGLSPLEFIASLRAEGRTIPIIVMTAFPDEQLRRRSLALGALLVAKPFALDAFCGAVRWLIGSTSHRTDILVEEGVAWMH